VSDAIICLIQTSIFIVLPFSLYQPFSQLPQEPHRSSPDGMGEAGW